MLKKEQNLDGYANLSIHESAQMTLENKKPKDFSTSKMLPFNSNNKSRNAINMLTTIDNLIPTSNAVMSNACL